MKLSLALLAATGILLGACQQFHPAAQNVPVLEVHH